MRVKRIVYPIHTLGYGKRIGIWTCGCPHQCNNCTSPELWDDNCDEINVFDLFEQIKPYILEADGITISGGDPMVQAKELARFVTMIKQIYPIEILVYTGYTLAQLEQDPSFFWDDMKPHIDVLIDGLYIEELNDDKALRGSSNQTIHYRSKDLEEKYKPLLSQERIIQDFVENGAIYIFGIPPKGFREDVKLKLQKDGFKTTL